MDDVIAEGWPMELPVVQVGRPIVHARASGIDWFCGSAVVENTPSVRVLRRLDLPLCIARDGYVNHLNVRSGIIGMKPSGAACWPQVEFLDKQHQFRWNDVP